MPTPGPGPWRKGAWLAGLLVLLLAGCRPATVAVAPSTPVLAEPRLDAPVVTVLSMPATLAAEEVVRVYPRAPDLRQDRTRHPLTVYTDFYRVTLADGRPGWVSEDLRVDPVSGAITPRPSPLPRWRNLFLLGLAGLVGLGLAWWRRGGWARLGDPQPGCSAWLALGWLCLLRVTLLALAVFLAGRLMIQPTEEYGHFAIARNLLDGQIQEHWAQTIGQGLLYLPLVALTGARDYHGIVAPLSVFAAFVLSPLALVLVYAILTRLGATTRQALLVVALLAVLPFVYVPVEQHAARAGMREVFKAIFMLPDLSPASYSLYHLYYWTGLNGLGDTPGMVLLLLCLWLTLRLAPGRRNLVLLAALFGLACLVRLHHLLFAPLLAYLCWERLRPQLRAPAQALGWAGLAAAGFLAVFGWQLLVNRVQYGNWLAFPTEPRANWLEPGFSFEQLKRCGRYLVQCNYLFMVLAAAGVLFVREPRLRIVLLLWAMPLLLFLASQAVVTTSSIRFLLPCYGALLALVVLARPWEEVPAARAVALTAVIVVNLILVAPTALAAPPYPLQLERWPNGARLAQQFALFLPLASLAITVALCREQRRTMRFMIAVLGLWYAASGMLVLAVLAGALIWALTDALREVRTWWLDLPQPPQP